MPGSGHTKRNTFTSPSKKPKRGSPQGLLVSEPYEDLPNEDIYSTRAA